MSKPVAITYRIPSDIKDRLDKSADDNHRSSNAELVYRLEKSLSADDSTHDKLDEIIVRLKALNAQ